MATLEKGEVYTLKVLDLQEHASDFKPNKSDLDKIYCHSIKLEDNTGEEYIGQICTGFKFFKECQPGDTVSVKVKQLSQGTYTFSELKNLSEVVPSVTKANDTALRETLNPHLAGTAAAIALNAAIQLVCNSEVPPGTEINAQLVMAEADILHEWLLLKA